MRFTFPHDGLAFCYLDEGSGAPFVFQHGLGGDAAQPRALWSGKGRLVCLECRGHGRTTPLGPTADLSFATFARDLAALLDALGLRQVALGGVSMGAGVAVRLAYEQPGRVRALALIRPAWYDAPSPPNLAAYPVIAGLLLSEGPERGRAALQRSAVYRRVERESRVTAESLLAQFTRPGAVARSPLLERLPADRPLSEPAPWPQLATPTLVVGTERDPVHPAACADAWARALPNATLRMVTPKAVDEERHAREVTAAVDTFLASPDVAAPGAT